MIRPETSENTLTNPEVSLIDLLINIIEQNGEQEVTKFTKEIV